MLSIILVLCNDMYISKLDYPLSAGYALHIELCDAIIFMEEVVVGGSQNHPKFLHHFSSVCKIMHCNDVKGHKITIEVVIT